MRAANGVDLTALIPERHIDAKSSDRSVGTVYVVANAFIESIIGGVVVLAFLWAGMKLLSDYIHISIGKDSSSVQAASEARTPSLDSPLAGDPAR